MEADTITLAPYSQADPHAIEALLDAAFGADRKARTAYRLREGARPIETLSVAAFDGERLVGVLQSWPVALIGEDGGSEPLVMVGPVAVAPDLQSRGLGRRMVEHMLRVADTGAADALMMIGDPEYYGRFFGFTADATGGWDVPGPVDHRRLLARIAPGRTLPAKGRLAPAA